MEDPETWRWIWLATAVTFVLGEIAIAGSFFLAPFAVGAAVACLLAFFDVELVWQWLAFVVISFGSFAALRPLSRRLDQGEPTDGIGSKRLIGETGTVLEEIPAGAHELGMVRVHREEWRAETVDGHPAVAGTSIQVVEQRGTRLIVTPKPGGGYPAVPPSSAETPAPPDQPPDQPKEP
jgi:membrane protein implicated in regulation of membrane protease activity